MKNLNLVRRFIIASFVMSATVPMLYFIGKNYLRESHLRQISEQACKAIEPMIQRGSQREPLEYLNSTIINQGAYAFPEIEMKDHGKLITPEIKHSLRKSHIDCEFQGISGIEIKVYYAPMSFFDHFIVFISWFYSCDVFYICLYEKSHFKITEKKLLILLSFK